MENEITQEKTAGVPVSDAKQQNQSENQQQPKRKLRLDEEGKPYAICPKCHNPIYNVVLTELDIITYMVSPDGENGLEYEEVDREADWNNEYKYHCPECKEVIAESEEEAEALFYEDEN